MDVRKNYYLSFSPFECLYAECCRNVTYEVQDGHGNEIEYVSTPEWDGSKYTVTIYENKAEHGHNYFTIVAKNLYKWGEYRS